MNDNYADDTSALCLLDSASFKKMLAQHLNTLEEIDKVINPKSNFKKIFSQIVKKFPYSADDVRFLLTDLTMDVGPLVDQAKKAHVVACIYTAMAIIVEKEGNMGKAITAIQIAAYHAGFASSFYHPRKQKAINKAQKGGIGKADRTRIINEKINTLLIENRPRNGWTGVVKAADALAPLLEEFITSEFGKIPDLGFSHETISKGIETNPSIKATYLSTANKRQQ